MRQPTVREVLALESKAWRAWGSLYSYVNFPYNYDVRFGSLRNNVESRRNPKFCANEFHRLVKWTAALVRDAEDTQRARAAGRGRFGP